MSYTTEQITAMRSAIARGVRKVQMGNEVVEYHSLQEMRVLLAEMEQSQATSPATRRHYPSMTRGT